MRTLGSCRESQESQTIDFLSAFSARIQNSIVLVCATWRWLWSGSKDRSTRATIWRSLVRDRQVLVQHFMGRRKGCALSLSKEPLPVGRLAARQRLKTTWGFRMESAGGSSQAGRVCKRYEWERRLL